MLPISAIAWDIDGTLIDSEPLHDAVLEEVCLAYGAHLSDLPADHFRGKHMPEVWSVLEPRLRPGLAYGEWKDAIIDRYVARAPELVPINGALEVMHAFAAAGIRQACVSNSGRRVVDANLAALGIDRLIEFSISLDDVTEGKPAPEPYATAARRLGLAPGAVAAVEDSLPGATSARAAGLVVFGLVHAGAAIAAAEVTIRQLAELPGLILSPASSLLAEEGIAHGL